MGKLHTLRREIQRNPDKFLKRVETIRGEVFYRVLPATRRKDGSWTGSLNFWLYGNYKNFVYKTLTEMGYKELQK